MTRELSLNNPMGLKQSTDKFQGEVQPSKDPVFKQFITMLEGIRAGAVTLLTYFNEHNLNTITGIINRWAPGSENDTEAYIADVATRTGYSADTVLDLNSASELEALVSAIIYHENGQAVDSFLISQAVMLAYA